MDKYVLVSEIKPGSKGENHWIIVVDQDREFWNLFGAFGNPQPIVGKAYLFTYEKNDRGYNDIKKITPLVNIFVKKALKEVANRNDFKRDFSIAVSYSVQLCIGGKIPLNSSTDGSEQGVVEMADIIYDRFQQKADEEMQKLDEAK